MAKKLILAYLMLLTSNFLGGSSPKSRVDPSSGLIVTRESSGARNKSSSPTTDVYVRMAAHGDQQARVTIDTETGRLAGGWRGYLPTRRNFFYGLTLVGTGVAIGVALTTCNEMQRACTGARSDLEPLVGDIRRIVTDFDVVKAVVCQLYPALCPSVPK